VDSVTRTKGIRYYRPGIPSDFVKHTLALYLDHGVDVVTDFNAQGIAIELSVPYNAGEENMCGYRIRMHGNSLSVLATGRSRQSYEVRGKERQELLRLFEKINHARCKERVPRKGPHRHRICT